MVVLFRFRRLVPQGLTSLASARPARAAVRLGVAILTMGDRPADLAALLDSVFAQQARRCGSWSWATARRYHRSPAQSKRFLGGGNAVRMAVVEQTGGRSIPHRSLLRHQ